MQHFSVLSLVLLLVILCVIQFGGVDGNSVRIHSNAAKPGTPHRDRCKKNHEHCDPPPHCHHDQKLREVRKSLNPTSCCPHYVCEYIQVEEKHGHCLNKCGLHRIDCDCHPKCLKAGDCCPDFVESCPQLLTRAQKAEIKAERGEDFFELLKQEKQRAKEEAEEAPEEIEYDSSEEELKAKFIETFGLSQENYLKLVQTHKSADEAFQSLGALMGAQAWGGEPEAKQDL